jgi:hypothetical protein
MENYATQVLEKELQLIEKCMSDFELSQYKDAKIDRQNKINELKQAIIKLKS